MIILLAMMQMTMMLMNLPQKWTQTNCKMFYMRVTCFIKLSCLNVKLSFLFDKNCGSIYFKHYTHQEIYEKG